jgi:opacity protein-like surface antigen
VKYDQGPSLGGTLGYRFNPHLRVEVGISYARFQAASLKLNAHSANFPRLDGEALIQQSGAQSSRLIETVDVVYDFPSLSGATPFVSLGAGAVDGWTSQGIFLEANGGQFNQAGGHGWRGAALAGAGVTFPLSAHWSLTPNYRYQRAVGPGRNNAVDLGQFSLTHAF